MALGQENFKQKARGMTKEGFQKAMGQDGKPKVNEKKHHRVYEEYPSAKYCK